MKLKTLDVVFVVVFGHLANRLLQKGRTSISIGGNKFSWHHNHWQPEKFPFTATAGPQNTAAELESDQPALPGANLDKRTALAHCRPEQLVCKAVFAGETGYSATKLEQGIKTSFSLRASLTGFN